MVCYVKGIPHMKNKNDHPHLHSAFSNSLFWLWIPGMLPFTLTAINLPKVRMTQAFMEELKIIKENRSATSIQCG